jgi:hypothetical protein
MTPAVLDTVNSVLNATRVRLNDALPALEATTGNLLDKTNPFSQQATNNAWRRLNGYLANRGFTALKQEVIVSEFPVVVATDPAIPCWIDWNGHNDGVTTRTTKVLPSDLLIPYKIWERPYGRGATFPIDPMELFIDGLPGLPKQTYNGGWEWRANRIYIPGALQKIDFRILYGRYLGDFVDTEVPPLPAPPGLPPTLTQWFEQLIPIPDCRNALSLSICAELALSHDQLGDPQAWMDKADAAADLLVNREVSMKQRGTFRKRSRSGRLEMGSAAWW